MEQTKNIAPMKLELLMAVVQTRKAPYYSSLIQSSQANLQLIMPAKGTTHMILNYLGFTDRPKSLIISVVRSDEAGKLISLLDDTFKKGKEYKGIAFTIEMTSVIGTLVYGFLSNDKRTVKEKE